MAAEIEQDEFHRTLEDANLVALWERGLWPNIADEVSNIWRWNTVEPLFTPAIEATSIENAERRAFILSNPAYAASGRDHISPNFSVTFQVLIPGEIAAVHRHSLNALRFVIEGEDEGAVTTVDGKPCPMTRGDLIITPGWTWHGHTHEGKNRAVWIDVIDAPIQRHLDTGVIEPGPAPNLPELASDDSFAVQGFSAVTDFPHNDDYSPKFRYPWKAALTALAAAPEAPDGSRKIRYTNPLTGGSAMAFIDCYLLGLAGTQKTQPERSTSNTVCVVVEGNGTSQIGDTTIEWGPNDVFTLPHGQWVSHQTASKEAKLFLITDRDIFDRLGLLKDELQT